MSSATDSQVLVKAVADGRVLLTADRGDFGCELAKGAFVVLAPNVVRVRYLPLR